MQIEWVFEFLPLVHVSLIHDSDDRVLILVERLTTLNHVVYDSFLLLKLFQYYIVLHLVNRETLFDCESSSIDEMLQFIDYIHRKKFGTSYLAHNVVDVVGFLENIL